MIAEVNQGRVITFYSYKGGTGRTMALANVASLMAQQRKSSGNILMIDWDLEAPGLDRYFRSFVTNRFPDPTTREQEFDAHPGLIDLFLELDAKTRAKEWEGNEDSEDAAVELIESIQMDQYVFETNIESLYLMKAGRRDAQYATKVNSFDWESLYRRSPWLIQAFAERLASQYSNVLIDSRTGVTDISGICTMLMPDVLVAVFTPNRQNLVGVLDQIRQATEYRLGSDDLRSLNVFPLPSRIELAEPDLRDNWRFGQSTDEIVGYQSQFEDLYKEVYGIADCSLESYFNEVQIQHLPRFSYGEDIAVLSERGQDRLSLTRSYENFVQRLESTTPWEAALSGSQESVPEVISTYWIGRPATIGDDLVGRNDELGMIGKAFEDSRVVVISGGGGSGKSRLAAEYTHQSNSHGFWTAASRDDIRTVAVLAHALNIDFESFQDHDFASEVQKVLAGMPPETLWVIDNLDRLEQIAPLLNAVSVRMLITTRDNRNNLLPRSVAFLQLPVLAPKPAIALLNSRSESDPNNRALSEIAELVGNLPLALEMLSIRLGEYSQTPESVLEQLNTVPTPIQLTRFQEAEGTTIERVEGVFNTITGTLSNLSSLIREQISPLGYIADAPIPNDLLKALIGIDDEGLNAVIEESRRYSVISIVNGEAVISALTIAAIAATNPDGALEVTVKRGLDRLARINRDDPVALRAEIPHYEEILIESRKRQIIEQPDAVEFGSNLAIGYGYLGRNVEAVHLYEEILDLRERVLGYEHPDTLRSRSDLAIGYGDVGRIADAVRLTEETLRTQEVVLGLEHRDTLQSRSDLAIGYGNLGRYEEAVQIAEEALEVAGRVLGPEHPNTLRIRSNLASGYGALGLDDKAVRLLDETLLIMERVLGEDHPDTIESRSNLAIGYGNLGQFEEAVRIGEMALHDTERLLGPEHPSTLRIRSNLASGYGALGLDEEAVRLLDETLRIMERVLGQDHPDTLATRSNLALAYSSLGRNDEAIRLEEETLRVRGEVLGTDHPDTLQSRNYLDQFYHAAGHNNDSNQADVN